MDEWEDTVAAYCLSFGLQFNFQIFARPRKAQGDGEQWYPSTVFLATHTLTAALRDVASRCELVAAPGTPADCAGLACAVRELHGTIFQPYDTWLKAAGLRPPVRQHYFQPNRDSLILELADLALYWLVYSEAANLRHTPEMVWFIFFCAQRSWQAKQVLWHLQLRISDLEEMAKQPWLAALGPGLLRAVRALHDRYRRTGEDLCGGDDNELLSEATLGPAATVKIHDSAVEDAAAVQVYGAAAAAAVVDAGGDGGGGGCLLSPHALRITVMADGSVSVPYSPYENAMGPASRHESYMGGCDDDAGAARDTGAATGAAGGGLRPPAAAAAAASTPADGVSSRRQGAVLDSPCLPLPPYISAPTLNAGGGGRAGSAFAASGALAAAAAVAAAAVSAAPLRRRDQPHHSLQLDPITSAPRSPVFDPRVPVRSYRELLLRVCPNEAAVAAALETEGGGGGSGGTHFLERVVQPLFLFLSEQVYELGQARRQGLEAAVRIGYDDVSESMAHPRVVAAALAALPWAATTAATVTPASAATATAATQPAAAQPEGGVVLERQQQQHVMPRAAVRDDELYWSRLLALSDLPSPSSARIPWHGDMEYHRKELLKLLQGGGGNGGGGRGGSGAAANGTGGTDRGSVPGRRTGPAGGRSGSSGSGSAESDDDDGGGSYDEEAPNPTLEQMAQAAAFAAAHTPDPAAGEELGRFRRANAAADWWALHVLRKTFAEHRCVVMPLLAFGRVFQFQLVWFYLLCVWSWSGPENRMQWLASAAVLHWGSNCLLWTMQALLSGGPRMTRDSMVIPAYDSREDRPRRGSRPAAPYRLHGMPYHIVQLCFLALAWAALGVGIYIGYQCHPLRWGHSCRWIAVAYGVVVVLYEMLYRQLNLGGYVREHLYDILLRLVPGQGTATASSSYNPLYDPATHLRTGLPYLLGNACLWGGALALKFAIDLFIIIRPAGRQLREVMRTNQLAQRLRADLDVCLAAAQVIVLFLLSLVSSGVAYTVATALWGSMQGVYQGVGSIRRWGHIRAGFHRVQAALRTKLLVQRVEDRAHAGQSWSRRAAARVGRATIAVLLLPYTCVSWVLRVLRVLPQPANDRPKSWVERETTLAMTAPFWNAVIRSMRGRDLLSDREAAALSFTAVSFSPASMLATWRRGGGGTLGPAGGDAQGRGRGGSDDWLPGGRETYLPPVAVYVAQLPQLVISGSAPSAEQLEVLQEAYLYLLHLLVAVGVVPRSAAAAAAAGTNQNGVPIRGGGTTRAAAAAATVPVCPDLHKDSFHPDKFAGMSPRAWSHRRLVARRELLGAVVALVRELRETGKVYKDTAAASASSGSAAESARSRAVDKLCNALHAVARCMAQMSDMPWEISLIMNRVVKRQHYHHPGVKAQLQRGFSTLVDSNRNHVTTWGAEHMPSYDDFTKVASWLAAILRPTDEGTAPSNAEAVSLLADFCSGLLHPGLPAAPLVEAMRSVWTLIPHYHETGLYGLSSADARRVLMAAGATSLEGKLQDDEVLFKNDEGEPTELLQYQLSEFPDEFRNLLERCRTLVPLGKDDPPYVLEDFLPGGRLYAHRVQLLLWASCRGQVLARTVDGMCMYRLALAMQAIHDALTEGGAAGHGPPRQQQQPSRPQAQGGAGGAGAGAGEGSSGRLKLSVPQRMQVLGILKDDSLPVEELVAQLVDVVPELESLLERKYGLVVSSQVYSKMAASRSLADRWRAHSVALLATRYRAMRVAYLEQDGEPITLFKAPNFAYRVVHQASVLVRAIPLEREVEARRKARAAKREAAKAAADAAATAAAAAADFPSPATTAMYGRGQVTPPPSVTSPASWGDALSVAEEGPAESSDDDDGDGEEGEDVGAALRVWRRRFQLKHLRAAELEVLYRQRLPINYYDRQAAGVGVILGEGKPENQNSAVPYCPGVLLQTIDMNQDNSLAQAFKLRNTTREFEPLGPGPQKQQVAVLGYPEWIFSYRCGLLADLAAATERVFGTQIQRVMAFPSAVRAHYGHPDLWNRLFSMTRGGVSKANAVQHVSEDVFGGYNALKRGGLSKYVSYISVGKGRDMGLDSILGFEGKISKGCAEQLMSRDLRFLGANTDFFRSMSLYFTVPGHFINTWLTVVTIQLGVWVHLLLLLGGVGKAGSSVASAVGAIQILQLGTMPLLGFLFNLWLESGLGVALSTLARQFIGGGLLFHIIRSVTSAFHLGRAVLFGGASYVATGRGFSLRRKTFTQVYCNYGRSHLYLGADILMMVVLILVVGNNGGNSVPVPVAALWSPLLVAASLLAGPFWFTPYFFRLNQVLRDAREFRGWMSSGSAARGMAESWHEWNAGQLATLRDDAGTQVARYRLWSTLTLVAPRAAIATLSAVTAARFETPGMPDLLWVLGGSCAFWMLSAALSATRQSYLKSGLAVRWRWAKGLVQVTTLGALVAVAVVCLFMDKKGLRLSGVLITLYANYSVASLLVCVLVVWMPKTMLARSLSNQAYRHADAVLGTALSAVLIVIVIIGEIGLIMVDKVQTLVQFNDRYSHTQAARRYGGDDDVAPGGGGGGGGLTAAVRRRLPSQVLMMAPPLSPRAGGGDGGGAVSRRPTSGDVPTQPGDSKPPPVTQGWVSPRFRDGGGASLFASFTAGNAHRSASDTQGSVSPVPRAASPSTNGGAAAAPPSALEPEVQRRAAVPSPPAAAATAMTTSGTGSGGGAASALTTATASPFPSWSSSTPGTAPRYSAMPGTAGGGRGGGAAAAALLASNGVQLSRSVDATSQSNSPSASTSSPSSSGAAGTASKHSRNRLPPVEEWRRVAAAAMAAGVSRAARRQPPPPPDEPSIPLLDLQQGQQQQQ